MALIDPAIIGALSAVVSLAGAGLTWRNARGVKLHAGYELARSLYGTLVSAQMCEVRDALEAYRRAAQRSRRDAKDILPSYFALLWCFEGILVGRRSLVRQWKLNGTGPAVTYLDDAIRWHLREWVKRWPQLRGLITEHVRDLDDQHSLRSLIELAVDVLGEGAEMESLRSQLPGNQ
ncbi:hypothetical protein NBRGN_038_01490 [Nocardia brasiliensis NBRC 14402]|uniref:hypothetical protein n=1 Tax=Nocardia brasiliensis TaxID=37326 RepID=UPI00045CCF49|nr:hypothetical protein [Nocardia brasiliensis]GAJ81478.1 hypothetical protein NBRGN_038_01490 [Nocardia brasiliensis NBRC 14402]SUB40748.1 Uncharacterised protein [Nocardia brasiliensis]